VHGRAARCRRGWAGQGVDALAGGVFELPVLIPGPREVRATAHGHDDVRGLDDPGSPWLGELLSNVDADLGHDRNR